jgi:CRISPR-associated protein Csm5
MGIELVLKTITPLHIGSGEYITSLEFIYDDKKIHVYNFDSLIKELEKRKLLLAFSSRLKRYEKHLTLEKILEENPILKKAFKEIQPFYSIHAEKKPAENIEAFVKVSGRVYIPGSELKGSLRRALLFYVLWKDEKLYSEIVKELKRVVNFYRKYKNRREALKKAEKISNRFENRIFRGGEQSNVQQDVMKFIRFSDSETYSPESMLGVCLIKVFYTNKNGFKKFDIYSEVANSEVEFRGITLSMNTRILSYYDCHPLIKKVIDSSPEKLLNTWSKIEKINLELDEELSHLVEKDIYRRLLNNGNLIRLGKHEGYLFTTLMALAKKRDKNLFKAFFEIISSRDFPNKTRKLTLNKREPLGFCTVEIA